MEWYEEPSKIEKLSNVDYLFAVDENGTSTLKNAASLDDNNKWFTVTGVLIDIKHFNNIKEDIVELKERYWENGFYDGRRVVFHAKDIRKKQGPFNPKIIDIDNFVDDMNEILSGMPIKIYSANIDKLKHRLQYSTPYPVYELGIEFIIERFCFEMRRRRNNGIVLLESRGPKEDKTVLHKMKKLIDYGNDYSDKDNFDCISGVYFNPKRTHDGAMSYWPLEVSDIISYSIYQHVKAEKETDTFNAIRRKIYGHPDIHGKGLKIFP